MIIFRKKDYSYLLAHAVKCLPEEACGLVGGQIDAKGNRVVEKVYLLENTDHSAEHFSLSPEDQLAAVKDMRKNGWKLLGNWHSHPETPSRPSEEDKRLAYDSQIRYFILSLMDRDAPELNAFRIEDNLAEKEQIVYVEG